MHVQPEHSIGSESLNGAALPMEKPEFDELGEQQKEAVREQVVRFLRSRCQQLLALNVNIDDLIRNPHLVDQRMDYLIGARKIKKGKRKAVLQRMQEMRRMLSEVVRITSQSSPLPPEAAQQEQMMGRRDADLEWTCNRAYPALRTLAETEVQDWDALRQASKSLPREQRRSWRTLLEETKGTVLLNGDAASPDDAPSPQYRFIQVLKSLNERWFMHRGQFLMRSPAKRLRYSQEGEEPPSLWETVKVGVNALEAVHVFPFRDEHIPVVYIRTLYPQPPEITPQIAYDGVQGCVVMTLNELEGNIHLLKALYESTAKPNPDLEKAMLGAGETQASIAGWKDYARIVCAQYGDDLQRMYRDMEARTLLEEVRHGIDGKRVRAIIGDTGKYGYYPKFADAMLTPHGQMRQVFHACTEENDRMLFGASMSELSAQMTAAAHSPNHTLMLSEWKKHMMERSHPTFTVDTSHPFAHADASSHALLLLAQELQLIPHVTVSPEKPSILTRLKRLALWQQNPQSFMEPDYRKLMKIADALMARTPQELRLALKSIYAREFALGEIDEEPFFAITEEGEMRDRHRPF